MSSLIALPDPDFPIARVPERWDRGVLSFSSESLTEDVEGITDVADEEAAARDRRRDSEFWYEDGTIILVASNIEFRVFKGLLVDRSPVFRDMVSFPQPPSSLQEKIPCPEVALSDSAEDLRELLRVLMPGSDSR